MTDYQSIYDISSKGFIPDKCLLNCPIDFRYLDDFLFLYQKKSFNEFDDFRNFIKDYPYMNDKPKITFENFKLDEIKKLYSVTSILCHLYVWSGEYNDKNIPKCLAIPWFESSQQLDIPPVLTHAAVDLYNWRIINSDLPFSLDNIKPIYTFNLEKNVKKSEEWFYLPMIAIEGECGCILHKMEEIYNILETDTIQENTNIFIDNLKFIKNKLERQYEILKQTRNCKPEHFYHNVRPFLGGSTDGDGWYLEGVDMYVLYEGGSAAQSSLIQAEDIFFGIKHPNDKFLEKMRSYMPGVHRNYLENQLDRPQVSQGIDKISDEFRGDVEVLYKECIKLISKFRKYHYGIVQDYVKKFNSNKGTGGTDINKNLKEYINNTKKQLQTQEDSIDFDDFEQYYYLNFVNMASFISLFLIIYIYIHSCFVLFRGWKFIIKSTFNDSIPYPLSVLDYTELY